MLPGREHENVLTVALRHVLVSPYFSSQAINNHVILFMKAFRPILRPLTVDMVCSVLLRYSSGKKHDRSETCKRLNEGVCALLGKLLRHLQRHDYIECPVHVERLFEIKWHKALFSYF